MFRIEAFCDDKHLARVHHALNGLVMNLSTQPVANGKVVNGKAKATTNGSVVDNFTAYAKAQGLEQVVATDMKAFCTAIGRAEGGYSSVLSKLQAEGVLKKTAKKAEGKVLYKVVL